MDMERRSWATPLRSFHLTKRSELRTMCTMHNGTSVSGYRFSIASGKPLSPSTQAIRMSRTSRLRSSVGLLSQNFAPLFSPIHSPRSSFPYSSSR